MAFGLFRVHPYTNVRIVRLSETGALRRHAQRDLAGFPEAARRRAGYELFMVQVGREPADFKPIPTVGSGAYEKLIGAGA